MYNYCPFLLFNTHMFQTPKPYCGSHTVADVRQAISLIKEKHPTATLVGIGISLGSLLLGRYLASSRTESHLFCSLFFSCPFDTVQSIKAIETWDNYWIISRPLARAIQANYMEYKHLYSSVVDHKRVIRSRSLSELDSHLTAPIFGYLSAKDYHKDCLITGSMLQQISVPTLCVNASDDPFAPEYGKNTQDL